MKKLSAIKLNEATVMSDSEMKNVIGGSGTSGTQPCGDGLKEYTCYFRHPGYLNTENYCAISREEAESGPAREYLDMYSASGDPVIFAGCHDQS